MKLLPVASSATERQSYLMRFAVRYRRGRIGWPLVGRPVVRIVDAEIILDAAVEQRPDRFFATEELVDGMSASGAASGVWVKLGLLPVPVKSNVASVYAARIQRQGIAEVDAGLGTSRSCCRSCTIRLLPGWQQL